MLVTGATVFAAGRHDSLFDPTGRERTNANGFTSFRYDDPRALVSILATLGGSRRRGGGPPRPGRFPRALVGPGGAVTAIAVSLGLGSSRSAAAQTNTPPYTVIRKYVLTGSTDAAVQELNTGYLPQLQQETGYLQYIVVTSDPNTLTTIAVFDTQANFTAAEDNLSTWVTQNLASLLPSASEETKGNGVIWDPNAEVVCGPAPTPTPVPPTPTPVPATPEPCTAIGCACNGGVEGACDEGLVCCQSQMGGGPVPGGAGMCAAADACGDATPMP